jgi:predicted tellurium resistance membrane protein TerC
MLDNLLTLGMLIILQAVLGFDNLLYVSLESKNAPENKQSFVRKIGIGLAILLRIILLFILTSVIQYFQEPIIFLDIEGIIHYSINIHSIIVLVGGVFILYTAIKEIWHMISLEEDEEVNKKKSKSTGQVIFMIVIMNLVFSFDSILSAMALSEVFWVMATAIIIGGILMIVLADRISNFLKKNRAYEVLGLFILFLVGIMLLSEGGHLAHLTILDNEITPMSKATFYFVIAILIVTDISQSRYQKKILKQREINQSSKENDV